VATVVGVHRSAPRPVGSKMAVNSRLQIEGAVSGGCVEGAVVTLAEEILGGARPRLVHYGIADSEAWDVGLPCGGEIDVWVELFEPGGRFIDLALAGGRGAEVTLLGAGGPKLCVDADGARTGSLGSPEMDDAAFEMASELMWAERSERRGDLFVDVTAPSPRLILFGAVDVAAAVCTIARDAGWRPYVVDPRARFATADRFPDAVEVIAAWPEEAFARLGGIDRATSIAVLTHDPKLDDAALLLALRSQARFVGAMGSRRAQESRRARLAALGLTDAELLRLSAPLGLDLGASDARETALSIMSEIVALRHGHTGGRLATASGRIHEVAA
jgi:xanthine dehydrogenase accessory factor